MTLAKWVKVNVGICKENSYFAQTEVSGTAQKMRICMKDFFSKCDQIRRILRIRSHLLKKSLMENFIFCAVRSTFSEKNARSQKYHKIYSLDFSEVFCDRHSKRIINFYIFQDNSDHAKKISLWTLLGATLACFIFLVSLIFFTL